MPMYKKGKLKKMKMSYPQGDEMTRSEMPKKIKPPKKINYVHKEGK